ncbi:hypothetical protein AVEN_243099-1 [Araneus ventricosus]|uniref:Uncharacterized protein n=1 Tax=Araneus ventricosus TaxID=182803 RepID=A0A4Y2G482_ARAVE|nr:hypothetical protein AVEN_243099-1 [Araneus ventricosus]
MPSRITLATPYWIEKVCTKRSLSPSPNDKGKPAPVAADKRAGEIGGGRGFCLGARRDAANAFTLSWHPGDSLSLQGERFFCRATSVGFGLRVRIYSLVHGCLTFLK